VGRELSATGTGLCQMSVVVAAGTSLTTNCTSCSCSLSRNLFSFRQTERKTDYFYLVTLTNYITFYCQTQTSSSCYTSIQLSHLILKLRAISLIMYLAIKPCMRHGDNLHTFINPSLDEDRWSPSRSGHHYYHENLNVAIETLVKKVKLSLCLTN
jgi:hypothetical protein